ncbi:MFS transporter [Streptomyces sp. NBC_01775]|uniref:MFS transporter n=1 Tax=Streptomyces sp. NBC_01775 TaxID=2975939 RepID=UPI002DD910A6|nr:MFS transporter [Streptomyces sp. NBC_01775]WSB79604.1 MFS transporter [Streptomyces sp. NBC_01775]
MRTTRSGPAAPRPAAPHPAALPPAAPRPADAHAAATPATPRTGLASRDFLLLLASTAAVFGNSSPLLSVVPLWAEHGGGGHGGAGATTALTMATTVAAQLAMGRVLRRFPARHALTAGALTMGLPAFAYALSPALPLTLALSAVRGLGFGMVTVAGSALVAELVPPAQRGRAVGWYGVAVGLPAVALLPPAVWCAAEFGFGPVFLATAALGVLAAPLSALISHDAGHDADHNAGPNAGHTAVAEPGEDASAAPREDTTGGARPGLRALATPWLLLFVSVCALGSLMSFLPLALTAPGTAPTALLTVSLALIVGRWAAGEWSDRRGAAGRLAAPAALACALGTAAFAAVGTLPAGRALPVGIAAGLVFGLGMGALQNDTLVAMFHRAGPAHHGTVSAVWNMGYDSGFGAGALLTGVLAQALALSLPTTFLVLAATVATVLLMTTVSARGGARSRERDPDDGRPPNA